jgi:hypothetical protein
VIAALQDQWLAIDSRRPSRSNETPLCVPLASGGVVVDADPELEALCRRLKDDRRTSLTIRFAARR